MPTELMTVRVGIRSPLESVTSFGVTALTRVLVRISTPSVSSRCTALSPSRGCAFVDCTPAW